MVTNIKRNDCRLLHNDISISPKKRRRKLFRFNLVTTVLDQRMIFTKERLLRGRFILREGLLLGRIIRRELFLLGSIIRREVLLNERFIIEEKDY